MFERFTDAARRVVVHAQEESRRMGDPFIGSQHLLLGALAGGDDVAQVLVDAGLDADAARGWLARSRLAGTAPATGYIPFTSNAKRALEASAQFADQSGRRTLGPADLLLGILDFPETTAGRLLEEQAVDLPQLKERVAALGGSGRPRSGRVVEAVRGDITTQRVDAIVNAANSSLLGGGGVDGAIHRAAGPELLAACKEVRRTAYPDGLPVGDAVATPGANLAAQWVIHTVGPNWHRGQRDPELLRRCFTRSLDVAAELGARSVAVPAVSAGVYGWDPAVVANIAVDAALRPEHGRGVELVRFVLFGDAVMYEFSRALTVHGVDPAG